MPLWAPPWASWFLFIISLNPHSLCNEVGSVIPGFSRRKPRLWERLCTEERWRWELDPVGLLSDPRVLGQPLQTLPTGFLSCTPVTRVSPTLLGCTGLCPLPPGLGSQLRFLSGCHPGDKVWLQEKAGVGWVAWGSGFLRQPRVGAWGASSHEIPSQGMWSGGPALREPGTRALGNTQQTGCSAPSWPPTLPPLRGSQAAYGGHTLLCLRNTMSGSLKQSCC